MQNLVKIALALVLAGAAACASGSSAQPPQSPAPAATAEPAKPELKAAGEAKVGDRTRCPASGEEFVVSESSPKFEYKGKTYYFCCGGCEHKFAKDPEKFLNRPAGQNDT